MMLSVKFHDFEMFTRITSFVLDFLIFNSFDVPNVRSRYILYKRNTYLVATTDERIYCVRIDHTVANQMSVFPVVLSFSFNAAISTSKKEKEYTCIQKINDL